MKKPFFSLIIIALAVMTMSYAIHKHYISLTRIEYSQEDKALQITMRFFIDDLEKAVETQWAPTAFLFLSSAQLGISGSRRRLARQRPAAGRTGE